MTLPANVHHYTADDEVPQAIWKYWQQRFEIFSRYDDGVRLTDDAWFGVTPEPVAIEIAKQVAKAPPSKTVLIDAFGGAGGNAIQFALSEVDGKARWSRIFVIEKDADVLACAKHNAELYGVLKKIFFIHGDIFKVLKTQLRSVKDAVIFGSPPWGGPSYTDYDIFDLSQMEPYSIDQICTAFNSHSSHSVLFLPRTSDLEQVAQHAAGRKVDVVHYCMHGNSKGLCVYLGEWSS